jgi:hypothetical protein
MPASISCRSEATTSVFDQKIVSDTGSNIMSFSSVASEVFLSPRS